MHARSTLDWSQSKIFLVHTWHCFSSFLFCFIIFSATFKREIKVSRRLLPKTQLILHDVTEQT